METIIIKRKEFTILEQLGERSYKVQRKDKVYFLKKYEGDKEAFNAFVKVAHRFSITAITTPKVYLYDKNNLIVVMQYIEGEKVLDILIKEKLPEDVLQMVFQMNYYGKVEKMALNFMPDQYKFDGKKLYYLPFTYLEYKGKDSFTGEGIKYWFYTKDLVKYLKEEGLPYDEKRIGNEFATNKEMALMTIKYYR